MAKITTTIKSKASQVKQLRMFGWFGEQNRGLTIILTCIVLFLLLPALFITVTGRRMIGGNSSATPPGGGGTKHVDSASTGSSENYEDMRRQRDEARAAADKLRAEQPNQSIGMNGSPLPQEIKFPDLTIPAGTELPRISVEAPANGEWSDWKNLPPGAKRFEWFDPVTAEVVDATGKITQTYDFKEPTTLARYPFTITPAKIRVKNYNYEKELGTPTPTSAPTTQGQYVRKLWLVILPG